MSTNPKYDDTAGIYMDLHQWFIEFLMKSPPLRVNVFLETFYEKEFKQNQTEFRIEKEIMKL